ncbi:MAG TPA: universal stress protein [Caulifigura sp.]|jgi:nucleotide-binding universal stress UspA family protein|nr:universal stress protein [Caulifigura sp.]
MLDPREPRRTTQAESISLEAQRRHAVRQREADHILVPISFSAGDDLAAVRLGLQMAAGTDTRVTLLHVSDPPPQAPAPNWLDSIDRLHDALSHSTAADSRPSADNCAEQLQAYLFRLGLSSLLAHTSTTLELRIGDFCEEVLKLAEAEQVDVVVLRGDQVQGWIPVIPSRLRRTLQRMGKRVLAIWPETGRSPREEHREQIAGSMLSVAALPG